MEINDNGKYKIINGVKILIEPSDQFLTRREAENQIRIEQNALKNLIPSEKEVLMAEIELNTLNLLIDLEVL